MVYQVIDSGWLYEVDSEGHCHVEGDGQGGLVLVVEDDGERLAPRALVRAAKDRLLGLTCGRSWRVDRGPGPDTPAASIRVLGAAR
ncbi:MAG: hypothetical protein U0835_16220 [Isosphaeraceae bacterium]